VSLVKRAIEQRATYPLFNQTSNPLNLLYGQTSIMSSAGERVDEVTALGVASVLSCVSLLADSVASMRLRCYEMVNNERVQVPLPPEIAQPDPAESSLYEFLHQITASLAMHGNAYVLKDRAKTGRETGNVLGLLPLHPYQINVLADKRQGGRQYIHLGTQLPRDDVMHLRWFTPPQSLVGISPIVQQRTVIGLAMAMDRHLAQFYGEGGTPSSVLESDRDITPEQARTLRDTWTLTHRRHRKPAILTGGLRWKPITTSAADSELNATRDSVMADVARIFRIPAYLVGVKGDSQTYANAEMASIHFLTYTLRPWLVRIENALSELLPVGISLEFDPTDLLRLDSKTKAEVDHLRIASGTRNRNEIRLGDGLNPYDGGEQFVTVLPGNIVSGQDPEAVANG
jgi:HK97 family phage portal protein